MTYSRQQVVDYTIFLSENGNFLMSPFPKPIKSPFIVFLVFNPIVSLSFYYIISLITI